MERARAATVRRCGRGVDRPRDRLRQDGPPQPAAPAPPRRPGGDRFPGRDRDQSEVLPRPSWRPNRMARRRHRSTALEATIATTTWAFVHGVDIVRVHDVAPARAGVRLPGPGPAAAGSRPRPDTRPGTPVRPLGAGGSSPMKGKWARGITPRFFAWIIKGHLAVSERPGGYARNHRKVRRHEEILWLRGRGVHPGGVVAPVPAQPSRLRRDGT